MSNLLPIVLASSSETRKSQLNKIGVKFTSFSPNIDETVLINETADMLVKRLSIEKSYAVANKYNNHLIIAGDQVMCIGKEIVGKPKSDLDAQQHLTNCSGKFALFYTGVCILNSKNNKHFAKVVSTKVKFKVLDEVVIKKYLSLDKPYGCAGSIQMEAAGMLLVDRVYSDDPFAMLGLPITILNDLFSYHNFNMIDYCFTS